MKIVTYLLGALLAAALGAAALFYFTTFEPMQAKFAKIEPILPELEKANLELKRYKKKEAEEAAWTGPATTALNAGLSDELKAGTAEVAYTGNAVVVNIAEQLLYTPGSVTFAKDTQFRLKLTGLLAVPELKGKQITIANTTDPVQAQGKGRKRTPPKDARSLAADRSVALAKSLEPKIDANLLVAAAFSSKLPDTGFKIKERKTVIVIGNALAPVPGPQQPKPAGAPSAPATQPSVTTRPSATAAPTVAPQAIPLKPAQPKGQ